MSTDLFQLLKKYDVAGPRYTSYPTVPAWVESVTEKDYHNHLKLLKAGEHLSLYFQLARHSGLIRPAVLYNRLHLPCPRNKLNNSVAFTLVIRNGLFALIAVFVILDNRCLR